MAKSSCRPLNLTVARCFFRVKIPSKRCLGWSTIIQVVPALFTLQRATGIPRWTSRNPLRETKSFGTGTQQKVTKRPSSMKLATQLGTNSRASPIDPSSMMPVCSHRSQWPLLIIQLAARTCGSSPATKSSRTPTQMWFTRSHRPWSKFRMQINISAFQSLMAPSISYQPLGWFI